MRSEGIHAEDGNMWEEPSKYFPFHNLLKIEVESFEHYAFLDFIGAANLESHI